MKVNLKTVSKNLFNKKQTNFHMNIVNRSRLKKGFNIYKQKLKANKLFSILFSKQLFYIT